MQLAMYVLFLFAECMMLFLHVILKCAAVYVVQVGPMANKKMNSVKLVEKEIKYRFVGVGKWLLKFFLYPLNRTMLN